MKFHHEILRRLPAGWKIVHGREHPKPVSPCGKRRFPVPKTPGDRRVMRNIIAQVRREVTQHE